MLLFIYLSLIFFGVFGCSPPSSSVQSSWSFTLYTRSNPISGTPLLQNSNPNDKTVVIVHGWLQQGNFFWVLDMKDAYLNAYQANVIVVDWSQSANQIPNVAACHVPYVGDKLANVLNVLHNSGRINIANTELVGFSFGGHVVGVAGKKFIGLSGGTKVGRILGLDVASMGYIAFVPTGSRLKSTDANFVQAFHTNDVGSIAYGTMDVYFNAEQTCSAVQPGCPSTPGIHVNNPTLSSLFCNHIRAVAYATECISSNNFLAVNCTCQSVTQGSCNLPVYVPIGDKAPSSTTPGRYFVRTRSQNPFALGPFLLN